MSYDCKPVMRAAGGAAGSDIYGMAYYVDSSFTAAAKNISIYLSPTTSFFNGSVCVANTTFVATGTTPNRVNCTTTIANALYVTVVKYTFSGSDQLHCNELQILRSGEAACMHVHMTYSLFCRRTDTQREVELCKRAGGGKANCTRMDWHCSRPFRAHTAEQCVVCFALRSAERLRHLLSV